MAKKKTKKDQRKRETKRVLATIEEAWACHEALRRLKIPSDDIFLEVLGSTPPLVFVTIRRNNTRLFYVGVGSTTDPKGFIERWTSFVEKLGKGGIPEGDLQKAYEGSRVRQTSMTLVALLVKAGLYGVGPPPSVGALTNWKPPGGVAQ